MRIARPLPFRPSVKQVQAATFIGFNILLLALIVFGICRPIYSAFADRDDRIQQLSDTNRRYRAFLKRSSAAEVTKVARPLELFEAASDGSLDARLQTLLKQKVEAAGAHLSSTGSLPSKTGIGVRYAGAHLDFAGPTRAVQAAILAIESNVPYLFVETVGLSSSPSSTPAASEAEVQVQMDVYGPVERNDRQ